MSGENTHYRQQLFDQILKANGKKSLPSDLNAAFQNLITNKENNLSLISNPIKTFIENAKFAGCELIELTALGAIDAVISERIVDRSSLAVSPQKELQQVLPVAATNIRAARWGIVMADTGIAETGTVCLHSHVVPSELLFLVESLIVVLKCSDIVARQEQVWQKMAVGKGGSNPRAMHLITGPSRTADVEQILQIGAHGPKELLIILID